MERCSKGSQKLLNLKCVNLYIQGMGGACLQQFTINSVIVTHTTKTTQLHQYIYVYEDEVFVYLYRRKRNIILHNDFIT
jgi:hypothetical protein